MKRLDDRGSMPLAMLVVLVGMALSGTLAATVITQVRTADFNARRVQALHAAQAGLDAGLATVRGSVGSDGKGDTALLPCGPLKGTVDTSTSAEYTVDLVYFSVDPQGQPIPPDDDGDGKPDYEDMPGYVACLKARDKDPGPAFVMFNSTGHAAKGATTTRQLRGTYIVHTDNTNISGGGIRAIRASASDPELCFDSQHPQPAAGTEVLMKSCSPGATTQTWAYNDTLQWVLVSSQTDNPNTTMCWDVPYSNTTSNPISRTGTYFLKLQKCQDTKPGLFRQQWSFHDDATLRGSKSDGTDFDNFCLRPEDPKTPDKRVTAASCSGGAATYGADANVGAGQAAAKDGGQKIGQLINYNQFGRCLDATGQKVEVHMIAWPCKQNPNPAKVLWNQRYAMPALPSATDPKMAGDVKNKATGTISLNYTDGYAYCLQSPGSPALYKYVIPYKCDGNTLQLWTVFGHTDQYATSYQIMDSTGKYCLQPRDPYTATPDLFATANKVSKIYVGVCSGSTLQKWNADKNIVDAMALKDVGEAPRVSGN